MYNYGKIVSGANPNTTKFFEDSFQYFISSWNVFFYFDIIPEADAESFNITQRLSWENYWYAQDKNNKYYMGKIVSN